MPIPNFFAELPREMVVKIFQETSRSDQAKLAQVDRRFNEIAHDTSLELSQFKKQKCAQAIAAKDSKAIGSCLARGFIPDDLQAPIIVRSCYGQEVSRTLIQILLMDNNLAQDAVYFNIADKLLQRGATLPQPFDQKKHMPQHQIILIT